MSRVFLRMALGAAVMVAILIVASAGLAPATSVPSPSFQEGWQQAQTRIGLEFQRQGYIVLAGKNPPTPTVRDHRKKSGGQGDPNPQGGVWVSSPPATRDHRSGEKYRVPNPAITFPFHGF